MPTPIPTTTPTTAADSSTPDAIQMQNALAAKRDEIERMRPDELFTARGLDPVSATGLVIGRLPQILKHRDEIVAEFGDRGAALLDDLPTVAYAAAQANVDLTAADAATDLTDVAADLVEEHQLLLGDLDALANRKLIDRRRLDPGRSVLGYRTLITSVLVLVSVARESWAAVHDKTALTTADVDRIAGKAQAMLRVLEEREQGSTRMPALELRTRAFSLLYRQYGEVRRLLQFVRFWQDDADQIAPSLWASRRRRSASSAGEEDVLSPTPPVAPDAPATPASPATPPVSGPVAGDSPFTS